MAQPTRNPPSARQAVQARWSGIGHRPPSSLLRECVEDLDDSRAVCPVFHRGQWTFGPQILSTLLKKSCQQRNSCSHSFHRISPPLLTSHGRTWFLVAARFGRDDGHVPLLIICGRQKQFVIEVFLFDGGGFERASSFPLPVEVQAFDRKPSIFEHLLHPCR